MLTSLVILRHGLAGKRSRWGGDDETRPLDRSGLAQALTMAARLAPIPIDQVLTSPFVRCQQTVAPLAAVRRLPVVAVPWLLPTATREEAAAGLARLDGAVLLCTHGESIEPILGAVAELHRLPPELPTTLKKGAALHLDLADDTEPADRPPADDAEPADVVLISVPPLEPARRALTDLGLGPAAPQLGSGALGGGAAAPNGQATVSS